MRRRSILQNVGSSVVAQSASIALALVLPPLLIRIFGSESNGFLTSVNQYVRYFSLIEIGVVAAASVALYGPLATTDKHRVNEVFSEVHGFFRRVGWYSVAFSVAFAFLIPISLSESIPYFEGFLVALASCSVPVLGYFVFFKYHLVLTADQKAYVVVYSLAASSIVTVLCQILVIYLGCDLLVVAVLPPLISIVRMLLIRRHVVRTYTYLRIGVKAEQSYLDQKWDSLAINVSRLVKTVVPLIYINFVYGFEMASVFNVYVLIFSVGGSILEMAGNNLTASLGVVSTNERTTTTTLRKIFGSINILIFYLVGAISVCFYVLFLPFVEIYVGTQSQVDYVVPLLAVSFLLNEALTNIRFAPNMFIRAHGHYRQTRSSALVEVLLAIVFTPIGIVSFGFEGVLLGSMIATTYRTLYIFWYCNSKMLYQSSSSTLWLFIRVVLVSVVCACLLSSISIDMSNFNGWIRASVVIGFSALFLLIIFACLGEGTIRRKFFRAILGRQGG